MPEEETELVFYSMSLDQIFIVKRGLAECGLGFPYFKGRHHWLIYLGEL